MNMESTRRPFDRSKEPGLKKPRLAEENQRVPNPNLNGRPFSQRPAGNNPVQSRLGSSDRDSENNDSLGGSYHPQPPHHELVSQYKTALAELTFNSKPIITNLTIIAGENLPVAKAIAATVCANILEVPSEQKLPSLYLLDSIVKNIGRDYIKYFATKLPEVFCKAYRQVDPAVHPSMRHLFGTWKGVFPPQSLQMIEKELGFATAVNGSSTGSTNSKPDSQAHCPPHSIHVNPKYLERQRLQQPSRTKGMAIDISGPEINSLEDSDRLDKATSAGRPWFDPSVKMHNMQRSHRDTISENIRSEDDDCNYISDLSKKPGSEIGKTGKKVVEQGYNKPWYGGGSSVPEPITSQRNGLKIKQGFQNHSAFDPNLRTVQNIANKSSGTMSSSWKNSDEEEFMWDDMNSRLTDHSASDVSSSLKKHHWTIDDSDKLGLEDFEKPPIVHDYSSNKDIAALGHQVSARSLQKSNSMHEWNQSRTPLVRDHPQGYAAVSRLSTIGNSSLARMGGRPPMVASSHVGGSSFGFPTNTIGGSVEAPVQHRLQSLGAGSSSEPLLIRQHSPLPRPTLNHPHHQLQSLTEQDSPEAKSFDHAYSKASHFSGKLLKETQNQYYQESPVVPPSNVQLRSVEKSQLQGIKASSPSVPAFLSGHHYTSAHLEDSPLSDLSDEIQKSPLPQISDIGTFSSSNYAPISTNPLAAEISRESNTSSLLAAVMKSGILNSNSTSSSSPNLNFQETEKFPSGHIPLCTEPSSSSSYNSSAVPEISQNNVGQPQSLTTSTLSVGASGDASDVNNGPNPISNLLSSLVAKGLIGASKTELPNVLPSQVPNESKRKSPEITIMSTVSATADPSVSSIVLSTKNVAIPSEPPAAKTHSIIPQSSKLEIKNVVGFEFKSDVLRKFHPSVIEDLLDNYPHQCSKCGLKFKFQEQFNRHLEWHSIKKSEYIKVSRRWYVESSDWISGKAGLPLGFESAKSVEKPGQTKEKGELMVPADEIQCACVLCGEIFEDFYCQERDEWMFKGAVYMTIPSGAGDRGSTSEAVVKGPIVHADCISESSLLDLGLVSSIKMEEDA